MLWLLNARADKLREHEEYASTLPEQRARLEQKANELERTRAQLEQRLLSVTSSEGGRGNTTLRGPSRAPPPVRPVPTPNARGQAADERVLTNMKGELEEVKVRRLSAQRRLIGGAVCPRRVKRSDWRVTRVRWRSGRVRPDQPMGHRRGAPGGSRAIQVKSIALLCVGVAARPHFWRLSPCASALTTKSMPCTTRYNCSPALLKLTSRLMAASRCIFGLVGRGT